MLLAIDTATRQASIALYDARGVVVEHSWRSANNHSSETLPAIERALHLAQCTPADLTGVAVAKGPGSFTGLRIGMSVAKGMCLALGIPIVGVPTLDAVAYAVAHASGEHGRSVIAVLEAGRGRLSVAAYRFLGGLPTQQGALQLVASSEWAVAVQGPALIAGEVSPSLAEALRRRDAEGIALTAPAGSVRRAGYLAELAWIRLERGEADDLDTLSPIYARTAG